MNNFDKPAEPLTIEHAERADAIVGYGAQVVLGAARIAEPGPIVYNRAPSVTGAVRARHQRTSLSTASRLAGPNSGSAVRMRDPRTASELSDANQIQTSAERDLAGYPAWRLPV